MRVHEKLRGEAGPYLDGGSAMISTSIISLLLGATLAQRFKVVALVPAMAIVMILAAVAEGTPPQGIWWFFKIAAAAAVCLQIGFFAGIIAGHFLVGDSPEASPQLSPAEPQAGAMHHFDQATAGGPGPYGPIGHSKLL